VVTINYFYNPFHSRLNHPCNSSPNLHWLRKVLDHVDPRQDCDFARHSVFFDWVFYAQIVVYMYKISDRYTKNLALKVGLKVMGDPIINLFLIDWENTSQKNPQASK
jgi:quinol-cytochrome oxidoreductase complex cytochrome b subunit